MDSSESDPATSEERALELSPDEAFEFAIERHRAGALDDAEAVYGVLLDRWPDHPGVLNHMGLLRHQRGQFPAAFELLNRSLAIAPDVPGAWNNLGNVLMRLERIEQAEGAFRRSIELEESPAAWSNLGRVLRRRHLGIESEAACRRAIELAPDFGDAWHNLALALIGLDRVPEGVQAAVKATMLLPAHMRRRDSYARALALVGEVERAAEVYREWLADEPDNPYVKHHLAACTGEGAPPRASDAYVEQVFDRFASSFDAQLANLQYRAPQLVAEALRAALPAPANQFDIADLGCGTGLCGPLVKGWARHLSGCDLSGSMLDRAKLLGVYDELQKAELLQFLQAHEGRFDVVISADTLCYFGDLAQVAAATRRALRPGGRFVYTVEALKEGDKDESSGRLQASGRYAHGQPYLRSVLANAGLRCRHVVAETLRQEAGLPVGGWLVTASHD